MSLLKTKNASGERDYVREEIAEALKRKIVVIPVRVGREGQMPPLPRTDELPPDIRDLVLYQKHDVVHESFGRDIVELSKAISIVRRSPTQRARWGVIAAAAAGVLAVASIGAYHAGVPVGSPASSRAPLNENLVGAWNFSGVPITGGTFGGSVDYASDGSVKLVGLVSSSKQFAGGAGTMHCEGN